MERPRRLAGRECPVRRVGLVEGLVRVEADEAVEGAGMALDALDAGGGDLARGELAGADAVRRVAKGALGR